MESMVEAAVINRSLKKRARGRKRKRVYRNEKAKREKGRQKRVINYPEGTTYRARPTKDPAKQVQ